MKKYYNKNTNRWYNEGSIITIKNGNSIFSGIPNKKQLKDWGYEEYIAPTPIEPTEEDKARQRMSKIQIELSSMDYLTSKFIDGEDMTEYGDWQAKRKSLREEYRKIEESLNSD